MPTAASIRQGLSVIALTIIQSTHAQAAPLGQCVQSSAGLPAVETLARQVSSIASASGRGDGPCGEDQRSREMGALRVVFRSDCSIDIEQSWDTRTANKNRERTYTFNNDGRFTWFNSTEDYERLSQTTGMGAVILLPRSAESGSTPPVVEEEAGGEIVLITTSTGQKARFSKVTGDLVEIVGYEVKITQPINTHIDQTIAAKGAITVTPKAPGTIAISQGWRRGNDPMSLTAGAKSTLVTASGVRCSVANTLMYRFTPGTDNHEPIYPTGEALLNALKSVCPGL